MSDPNSDFPNSSDPIYFRLADNKIFPHGEKDVKAPFFL